MKQYKITLKHDTGKTRIVTSGDTPEEAVQKVLKSENAPETAVVSVKPHLPTITIYDIKFQLESEGKQIFYFCRKTLKFFKQTLKDFSVQKDAENYRYYISAPLPGGGRSERWYYPETNELRHVIK